MPQAGANVVISSRKQNHVDDAIKAIRAMGLGVEGVVAHMGSGKADAHQLAARTVEFFDGIDI